MIGAHASAHVLCCAKQTCSAASVRLCQAPSASATADVTSAQGPGYYHPGSVHLMQCLGHRVASPAAGQQADPTYYNCRQYRCMRRAGQRWESAVRRSIPESRFTQKPQQEFKLMYNVHDYS
jgi:hypothetical protein